ncbi:MAG: dockerin type I domain-containing protein [Sedimentisphaerales bacterium]
MKRQLIVISAVTLVCVGVCGATTSVVKNGSFENDGYIGLITQNTRPKYWCSVNYDSSKFYEYVYSDWSTNGGFSLTMYAVNTDFVKDDSATITQSVYLTSARQIVFDIYLYTDNGDWNTDTVTASVLIDNTEIWNSDGLTYTSGQFMGHIAVDVNETFKDSRPHFLTLRLKADTSSYHSYAYFAQWDSIGLSTTCGSTGYLPADLTHDCVVDINDLKVFADNWLTPNGLNLTDDNDVNFADFAEFAKSWMVDIRGKAFIPEPNFVFLDGDLNDDGIVDFADFAIFGNNWRGQGGSCVRSDLNGDGFVDFKDLALLFGQWTKTGGLYGL